MFQKFKCPVKDCKYECGLDVPEDEDNEFGFAKRVQLSKSLRDEHPNHLKTDRIAL